MTYSLKPENVLIDREGYAKITDFGLSKENIKSNKDAMTLCGTPEYLAPEVIEKKGHGKPVDWWSLGCIIFEMLTGNPPFQIGKDESKEVLFTKIRNCDIKFPDAISAECKDLLGRIFVPDPEKRIGSGPTGGQELVEHPWFAGVDWTAIYNKQVRPPFKPKLQSELDVKYIDSMFTATKFGETPDSMGSNSLAGGKWENFTYEGKEL